MSKIAWIACIVAFAMAALGIIGALTGQLVFLPVALIPLMAGIGILRRRAWAAYGFALYQVAQLLIVTFALFRGLASEESASVGVAVLLLVSIPLFFFAGKSLAVVESKRGWAWPWIAIAAVSTLLPLFVRGYLIPTPSMEDTLLVGDRIFVQCFPRPRPGRGDVVVFLFPADRSQVLVKRVIGIPGDRIQISAKNLYLNGTALNEPYVTHKIDSFDTFRDNFPGEPQGPVDDAAREMLEGHVVNGEVVVPEGTYFLLGDNRDNSLDSRYRGFVGASDLMGKPLLIYHSEEPAEELPDGTSSHRRVRWERLLKRL